MKKRHIATIRLLEYGGYIAQTGRIPAKDWQDRQILKIYRAANNLRALNSVPPRTYKVFMKKGVVEVT